MARVFPANNGRSWRRSLTRSSLLGSCACVLAAAVLRAYAQAGPTALPQPQQASTQVARTVANILGYVRWPDERAQVRLCVTGPTEFADGLLAEPYSLHARVESVVRRAPDDPHLVTSCDAIYIGTLDKEIGRALAQRLTTHPILTLAEVNPDCAIGAMVCLHVSTAHVRFRIDIDEVARSQIRVHANLLKLSRAGQTRP